MGKLADARAKAAQRTLDRIMTTTTNFKRHGRVICSHGHNHPSPESAAACEAAWRYALRKRLHTDELVAQLRAALARRAK